MNERSLESDFVTQPKHGADLLLITSPQFDGEVEINSSNERATTVRQNKLPETKQPKSTFSEGKKSTSFSASSSTAASVVRSLVERGCQISSNENVKKVKSSFVTVQRYLNNWFTLL